MKKLKVITVCGFGLGSSMLLKMKVEEVFKEKNIQASVETADMGSATSASCDLIFTSYELGEKMKPQTQAPIVMIKNFLDVKEIEQVGMPVVYEMLEASN